MSQEVKIDKDTVALCSQEVQYHIQNYMELIRKEQSVNEAGEILLLLLGVRETILGLLDTIAQHDALPLLTEEEKQAYTVAWNETSATDDGQMSIDDFIK